MLREVFSFAWKYHFNQFHGGIPRTFYRFVESGVNGTFQSYRG